MNPLDMLVLVFAASAILGLLSIILMFALKKTCAKKVFFYIAAIVALYTTYGGLRMYWPMYTGKALLSAAIGLADIVFIVLASICKDKEKLFLIARIIVSASVILGILNTFLF